MAQPVWALEQLQIANVPTKSTVCINRAPINVGLSVKNRTHSLQLTEHLTRLQTYIHTYNRHSKRSVRDLWFSQRHGCGLKFGSRPFEVSNATEQSPS
jgi:hypothetical protein